MDIANWGRTPPPPVTAADTGAGSTAVQTELPLFKAVAAVPNEIAASTARGDRWSERRVVIDPDTLELVAQTIDARTQDVVVQYPDRARLGMRAYIDGVTRRQEESTRSNEEAHRLPALMI